MKYFLIGFAIWLALAWLPQFIKNWINCIRFKKARKNAPPCEKWIYELWDKGGNKKCKKQK